MNIEWKNFVELKYISHKKQLEDILSDHFIECGKSGVLYNKNEIIQALMEYQANRNIYHFDVCTLGEKNFLVHYITLDKEGNRYFRTSVWIKENGLKLLFHQPSLLCMETELLKFNLLLIIVGPLNKVRLNKRWRK